MSGEQSFRVDISKPILTNCSTEAWPLCCINITMESGTTQGRVLVIRWPGTVGSVGQGRAGVGEERTRLSWRRHSIHPWIWQTKSRTISTHQQERTEPQDYCNHKLLWKRIFQNYFTGKTDHWHSRKVSTQEIPPVWGSFVTLISTATWVT